MHVESSFSCKHSQKIFLKKMSRLILLILVVICVTSTSSAPQSTLNSEQTSPSPQIQKVTQKQPEVNNPTVTKSIDTMMIVANGYYHQNFPQGFQPFLQPVFWRGK